MNVAIFTDNDFAKVNGVTTTLRSVVEHAPDDIHARIYTCEDTGVDTPDYLALRANGVDMPFYPDMQIYWPPLRQFLRRAFIEHVDLVHLTTPGPVGLAALWVAWRLGLPMIGSFHTDLVAYVRTLSHSKSLAALMRQYLRWPYGRCARILAPSESTRRILVDGRIDPAKIGIWPRGVSTSLFTPAKRSRTLREYWRVSDDRPALLYVGRLSHEKGLALIPSLESHLHHARVAHRIIVVGDGPMRAELQSALPDAVFMGTLPHHDVAVAMASADLFVFPSRTDTAGNVVLEAQASGLPVLVTDAGGPRENMVDGRTGHVCRTPLEIAHHAISLFRDPSRRARLSHAARAYADTRQWRSALTPLFETYRNIAAQPIARGPTRPASALQRRGVSPASMPKFQVH